MDERDVYTSLLHLLLVAVALTSVNKVGSGLVLPDALFTIVILVFYQFIKI